MNKKTVFITKLPQEVRCPFCKQMIDINLIRRSKGKTDEVEVYFPCPHYWKIVEEEVGYEVVFIQEDDHPSKGQRIRGISL